MKAGRVWIALALPVVAAAGWAGLAAACGSAGIRAGGDGEAAMWRDYYEKRYPALFYRLHALSRTPFGFRRSTRQSLARSRLRVS